MPTPTVRYRYVELCTIDVSLSKVLDQIDELQLWEVVSVQCVSLKACSWQTCVCSLDAQVQFFRQTGLCLPNVFSGNQLRRMQAAWCRALARADTEMANRTDERHMVALEELFAEVLPPPLRPAASKRVDCSCSAEKDPVLLDALDDRYNPPARGHHWAWGFTSDDVLAGVQAWAAVKGQSVQDGQRVWGRFGASGPANGWPHPSHRVIQVVISLRRMKVCRSLTLILALFPPTPYVHSFVCSHSSLCLHACLTSRHVHACTSAVGPIVVPGSHRVSLDPKHIDHNRATMPNQVEVRSKAGFRVCATLRFRSRSAK